LPGDVLLDLDGVSVREAADLVPSGQERYARVRVRRGKLKEPVERLIDVQGFRATPPAELAAAAALVGLAAAILLLGLLPLARVLTWMERSTVARISELVSRRPSRRWLAPFVFLTEIVARDPLPSGAGWGLAHRAAAAVSGRRRCVDRARNGSAPGRAGPRLAGALRRLAHRADHDRAHARRLASERWSLWSGSSARSR
jgi:hypothetical protein